MNAKPFQLMVTGVIPADAEEAARSRVMKLVEQALLTEALQADGVYLTGCFFRTGQPEQKGAVHGPAATVQQ